MTQPFKVFQVEYLKHDLTYRVKNAQGHRIAVCYLRETAELLVDALNAYPPALEGSLPGVPMTKRSVE